MAFNSEDNILRSVYFILVAVKHALFTVKIELTMKEINIRLSVFNQDSRRPIDAELTRTFANQDLANKDPVFSRIYSENNTRILVKIVTKNQIYIKK